MQSDELKVGGDEAARSTTLEPDGNDSRPYEDEAVKNHEDVVISGGQSNGKLAKTVIAFFST